MSAKIIILEKKNLISSILNAVELRLVVRAGGNYAASYPPLNYRSVLIYPPSPGLHCRQFSPDIILAAFLLLSGISLYSAATPYRQRIRTGQAPVCPKLHRSV